MNPQVNKLPEPHMVTVRYKDWCIFRPDILDPSDNPCLQHIPAEQMEDKRDMDHRYNQIDIDIEPNVGIPDNLRLFHKDWIYMG